MSLPINQMGGGGGLNDAALALANATPADVAAGKTFYAGSKELKAGSLIPYGVLSGTSTTKTTFTVTAPGEVLYGMAWAWYSTSSPSYFGLVFDKVPSINKLTSQTSGSQNGPKMSLSGNTVTFDASNSSLNWNLGYAVVYKE